jgi:hypothetical protein
MPSDVSLTKKSLRHCIGLALEQDPEAAAVWMSIHGSLIRRTQYSQRRTANPTNLVAFLPLSAYYSANSPHSPMNRKSGTCLAGLPRDSSHGHDRDAVVGHWHGRAGIGGCAPPSRHSLQPPNAAPPMAFSMPLMASPVRGEQLAWDALRLVRTGTCRRLRLAANRGVSAPLAVSWAPPDRPATHKA